MPVTCPFCRSDSSQVVSLFGSQLLFSQYRCTTCGSYFEGLRDFPLPLGEALSKGEGASEAADSASVSDPEGSDDGC